MAATFADGAPLPAGPLLSRHPVLQDQMCDAWHERPLVALATALPRACSCRCLLKRRHPLEGLETAGPSCHNRRCCTGGTPMAPDELAGSARRCQRPRIYRSFAGTRPRRRGFLTAPLASRARVKRLGKRRRSKGRRTTPSSCRVGHGFVSSRSGSGPFTFPDRPVHGKFDLARRDRDRVYDGRVYDE